MDQDPLQGGDVDLGIRPDRIRAPRVELFERVAGVAGEHDVTARVIDTDHGNVAGRVSGSLDDDDAPVLAEIAASRKRTEGTPIKAVGLWREPGWKWLAQDATHHP